MAEEIPNRTDVICHFPGERERLTHQTGDALAERIIETFPVIGFPGFLRDRFGLSRRNHAGVGIIWIRVKGGLLAVDRRNVGPHLSAPLSTAIPHMKRNDVARLPGHRNPDPLLVGLLPHEAA